MITTGASRAADQQRSRITSSQIDVGGRIGHLFQFPVSTKVAYDYFADIGTIFTLLPDVQEVIDFGRDRYRIVVGAADGHGHTMAALFDVETIGEPGEAIYVQPFQGAPTWKGKGLNFRGELWAEALFSPNGQGSNVKYSVEMNLGIPLPPVFQLMPKPILQTISDTAVSIKMRQMINGFVRDVTSDFNRRMLHA
jgi:hypothetical protein